MRRETVQLVHQAVSEGRHAFADKYETSALVCFVLKSNSHPNLGGGWTDYLDRKITTGSFDRGPCRSLKDDPPGPAAASES
jgi:hypothetical protein